MAFQTVETQILDDNDRYVTVKITGLANSTWTTNSIAIKANTLFGSNASQAFNPLALTRIQYSTDINPSGFIQLNWVSTVNVNTTIFNFGMSDDGVFDGIYIPNNANTPTGDLNLYISNVLSNNCFSFIITLAKETNNPNAQGVWSNGTSWF